MTTTTASQSSNTVYNRKQMKKKRKQKSVAPPTKEVLAWVMGMSQTKQRSEISAGMRVKVRFTKPKLKWYGGTVTDVSSTGSKIRILYDDGTKESATYPDKEIIVDDCGNGRHEVNAKAFRPKELLFGKSIPMSVPTRKIVRSSSSASPAARLGNGSTTPGDTGSVPFHDSGSNGGVDSGGGSASAPVSIASVSSNIAIPSLEKSHLQSQSQEVTLENIYDDTMKVKEECGATTKKDTLIVQARNEENKTETSHDNDCHQATFPKSDTSEPLKISSDLRQDTGNSLDVGGDQDSIVDKKHEKDIVKVKNDAARGNVGMHTSIPIENKIQSKPNISASTSSVLQENISTGPVDNRSNNSDAVHKSGESRFFEADISKDEKNGHGKIRATIGRGENASLSIASTGLQKQAKEGEDERSSPKHDALTNTTPIVSEAVSNLDKKDKGTANIMDRPKGSTKTMAVNSNESNILTSLPHSSADITNSDNIKDTTFENKQKQNTLEQGQNKDSLGPTGTGDNKNTPSRGGKVLGEVSTDEDNSIKRAASRSSAGRRSTPKVKKRNPSQEGAENSKQLLRKRRREKVEDGRRKKKKYDNDDAIVDNENWVQCEKCMKWRLIPSVENLPEKWYCEMNVTDSARNSCDAPEQTQEEVAKLKRKNKKKVALSSNRPKRPKSQSPMTVPSKRPNSEKSTAGNKSDKMKPHRSSPIPHSETAKNPDSGDECSSRNDENSQRSRYSLKTVKSDEETRGRGDNNNNLSLPANSRIKSNKRNRQSREQDDGKVKRKGRKPKEEKQQEWVQCDKCEKWRRLPARISPKDLPDVWYCSMNTWDPRSASCAIHEEDFPGVEQETNVGGIMRGNHRDKMPSSSSTTYRDLIPLKGTRPISERIRATESIFSSHAGADEHDREILGPPVVTYHNSSAFQQRTSFSKMNANEKNSGKSGLSLFALMAHSHLWQDLFLRRNENVLSNSLTHQTGSCSNAMKAMVYYALGSKTMAGHEVLFECQCGEWEELLWINLRSTCTLESVTFILHELVRDGLIEQVIPDFKTSKNYMGSGEICYRRTVIEGISSAFTAASTSTTELILSSKSNNAETSSVDNDIPSSKSIHISKPFRKRWIHSLSR